MDIITAETLTSYLRLPPDTDVAVFVDLANGIVGDIVGTLYPIPARVTAIALEVAARPVRNPSGYSSETIDDYTYRRDAETRQAGVYLTSSERVELGLLAGQLDGSAVYTVPLGGPDVWSW